MAYIPPMQNFMMIKVFVMNLHVRIYLSVYLLSRKETTEMCFQSETYFQLKLLWATFVDSELIGYKRHFPISNIISNFTRNREIKDDITTSHAVQNSRFDSYILSLTNLIDWRGREFIISGK